MARKPSRVKLDNPDLYEKRYIKVPYYIEKRDRNLFFVDEETGEVFDKYITVRDPRNGLGKPLVVKRKAGIRGFWGKALRGLAAVVAADKLTLPLAVARALFKAADKDADKAAVVVRSFGLADDGDLEAAVFALADVLENRELAELIQSWANPDERKKARAELIMKLVEMSTEE